MRAVAIPKSAVGKCAHDAIGRRRMCRPFFALAASSCLCMARCCVRRVQATCSAHTHLPCRHHESASSNRKATSDLRCHASQNDPQTHSRGRLTHPAHKIGGIPAADFAINNPASQRPECHDADNPSWDVPNNRQPSSDTDSDTRAALQKTGWANYGRRIGPGGRGEGAYGAADGPKQRAGTLRLAT